jgi:hypothetical protein
MAAKLSDLATGFRPQISCPAVIFMFTFVRVSNLTKIRDSCDTIYIIFLEIVSRMRYNI